MFERIATGWELAKESWYVLKMDKELVVFPLVSGIACLLVFVSFAGPLWQSDYLRVVSDEGGQLGSLAQDPVAWVILFAFYLVNYFVIVFFNSALVACAAIRFQGGAPTVSDGLRAARARLPQIFAWAAVSATVGLTLRLVESRGKLGQFASAAFGAAWTIGTYFVVPVLVIERLGPIDAVKRSMAVLKKTWGEALTANFGIGLIACLASMLAVVPLVVGFVMVFAGHAFTGGALIAAAILWLLVVSLVSTALNAILLAALYLYATEGAVPQHFDADLLREAFGGKDE